MPTYTNAIVASFQIAAALCQILITRLAQCIGGPAAAIIFRAGGVAGLAVVIFSTNRALVFAALIIRGAPNECHRRCVRTVSFEDALLQSGPAFSLAAHGCPLTLPRLCLVSHARAGLTKSTLNEHVPVDQRARWNPFALLSATGWSGTAFLGGVLADKIGYRRTFCITLGFHAASCVCLLPLLSYASGSCPWLRVMGAAPRVGGT